MEEPDRPVRPDTCRPDHTGFVEDGFHFARGQVIAEHAVACLVPLNEEQSGAVRPPVVRRDGAVEVELEVGPLSGREIPHRRPLVSLALVVERQSRLARNGRPALRVQRHARVHLLAHGRSCPRIDDAKGGMDEVAVLGVLETEERPIGRETATEKALAGAADENRLRRLMDHSRLVSVERDVDCEAVLVAQRGRDDARRLCQPAAPALRHAVQKRPRLTACEWLDKPLPGLRPRLVVEPQDALAVERGGAVGDADCMIGDAPSLAGGDVPCVHLPDTGLVRGVHGSLGCQRRPLGQEGDRHMKAPLPGRHDLSRAHRRPTLTETVS